MVTKSHTYLYQEITVLFLGRWHGIKWPQKSGVAFQLVLVTEASTWALLPTSDHWPWNAPPLPPSSLVSLSLWAAPALATLAPDSVFCTTTVATRDKRHSYLKAKYLLNYYRERRLERLNKIPLVWGNGRLAWVVSEGRCVTSFWRDVFLKAGSDPFRECPCLSRLL